MSKYINESLKKVNSNCASTGQYFKIDTKPIKDGMWARLPKPSHAVYPTIAIHVNHLTGKANPGQRRIKYLTGMSFNSVVAGIKGLNGYHGFSKEKYSNREVKNGYKYTFDLSHQNETGRVLSFHFKIIHSGTWELLTPAARSIYIVMRSFPFVDIELLEEEIDDYQENMVSEYYTTREYDLCNISTKQIQLLSGCKSNKTVYNGIDNLAKNGLLNDYTDDIYGYKTWRLFLVPQL